MNRDWAHLLLCKFIQDENGQAISEYGSTLAMVAVMAAALTLIFFPMLKLGFTTAFNVMCTGLNSMAAGATQGTM